MNEHDDPVILHKIKNKLIHISHGNLNVNPYCAMTELEIFAMCLDNDNYDDIKNGLLQNMLITYTKL